MYCRHCGKQVALQANYCPNCGKFIGDQNESGDPDGPSLSSDEQKRIDVDNVNEWLDEPDHNAETRPSLADSTADRIPEEEETFKLYTFIGKNKDYYKRKWEGVSHPESKAGWNWVAFFLPLFWFGYRKMYGWLFSYWGVTFLLSILGIVMMKNHSAEIGFIDLIDLAMAVLLGIYGNALYFRFATKRVADISVGRHAEQVYLQLSKKGGTSVGGVWSAIGLVLVSGIVTMVLTIVMFVNIPNEYRTFSPPPPVVNDTHASIMSFGTGWTNQDITGVTDNFSQGQAIYLSTDFDGPIGTSNFTLYLLEDQGSRKKVIVTRTEKINPKWAGLLYDLYDPDIDDFTLKPGHYIVQIIAKKKLESEGHFDVQGLPKGTSY